MAYNLNIEYEWDNSKAQDNLEKHGIGFTAIASFQWATAIIIPSDRSGESRWLALGYIGETLYALAYTTRGENRRIISLRRASARERRRYERET